MKVDRLARSCVPVLLLLTGDTPFCASALPQTPQPVAGKITALIPTGSVLREKKDYEAKKDMAGLWQDTGHNPTGGRGPLPPGGGCIPETGSPAPSGAATHDARKHP